MTQQYWNQASGNVAQIYEEQNVPSMFRPLAELTLQHVVVNESDQVIDVACGTGILGRLVAKKLGKGGSMMGVDLNYGMIEVAKQHTPATDASVEWQQGDATELPFPDASFDAAFCQQGLQFFPDKVAALKELRRVTTPGGSMILTVWSAVSPVNAAISDALARYVNDGAAQNALSPYAFRDPEVIKGLMIEAGIQGITMETLVVERLMGQGEDSILRLIAGTPYGVDLGKADEATQRAVAKDVAESLQEFRGDNGLVVPQETHLIRATA
ncbi:MAG: methyltransferase domain-containing protein [SAR202 cluster bacterium]|nr:methyltransferase domain-containing protein [SAR202 cluster bacterium]